MEFQDIAAALDTLGPCWRWIDSARPSGAASSSLTRRMACPGSGRGWTEARTGMVKD
jgi:hypothetical protein